MKVRILVFLVLIVTISFLIGCVARRNVPFNYTPSSVLNAEGELEIGNFKYLPAESGKVKPNEINWYVLGPGRLMLNKNISEVFHDAVSLVCGQLILL